MENASGGDIYQKIRYHIKKGSCFAEGVLWKYFI